MKLKSKIEKVQKMSPAVSPTPSTQPGAAFDNYTLPGLRVAAVELVNLGHALQSELKARNWTLAMTDEIPADLEAFNRAREAWSAERDLRKDSTKAFHAEVQLAAASRESAIASLRFILRNDASALEDPRLTVGRSKAPRTLSRWLNEAIPLVEKHEQELITYGFAADPVASVRERASALVGAIAVQEVNQKALPELAKTQLAARAKLVSSMEGLRRAGLMTFTGNKSVAKKFQKGLERKRKAKAIKASPAEIPAPAPAAESVAKPAESPATDAAKAAS